MTSEAQTRRQRENTSGDSCITCSQDVEENGVECNWCLRWEHCECAGITPDDQPRIDVYKYSFLPRTVPEWNRLDDEIIETDCVEEFKQKLAPSMYIVK